MRTTLLVPTLIFVLSVKAQTITEYRWWINDDVSTLTTTATVPAEDLTLDASLVLPALDKDYNTVTIQFKDSEGRYGAPYTMLYTRGTGPVSGYEWWIDDDIANTNSGDIGPNDVVDLVADLPTNLTSGTHLFTIRFSGVNGSWSVPLTSEFSFFTNVEEVPGISDLMLFPNPVDDRLTLCLNSAGSDRIQLGLIDPKGRTVQAETSWYPVGTATRTWDVGGLAPGTYGLRINGGKQGRVLWFQKY